MHLVQQFVQKLANMKKRIAPIRHDQLRASTTYLPGPGKQTTTGNSKVYSELGPSLSQGALLRAPMLWDGS